MRTPPSCIFLWNINYAVSEEENQPVTNERTQSAVDNFFAETSCLADTAKQSLQKILQKNPSAATPEEVNSAIKDVRQSKFEVIKYQSLRATLHAFRFPTERNLRELVGAESYDTLDPFLLLNNQKTNFFYSLDCSGYISYLSTIKGGLSEANVASSSQLAYNKKEIYMIGRLYVTPLIAKVMNPNLAKASFNFDSDSVSSVLYTVLNQLIENKKLSLMTPEFMDVLVYERSGKKNLQGNIDLTGKAGGNFGLGSATLSLQSSAGIGQNLSFDIPTIGIIKKGREQEYSIDQVKQKLKAAIEKTVLTQRKVENTLEFKSNLHRNLCENEDWLVSITKAGDTPETLLQGIKISPQFDNNEKICKFTMSLNGIEDKFIKPSFFTVSVYPSDKSEVFSNYGQSPPTIIHNINY